MSSLTVLGSGEGREREHVNAGVVCGKHGQRSRWVKHEEDEEIRRKREGGSS